MPRCAVVNCHCGYNGFPTPVRWFKVPKSQARRDQWEFRMNRKDFKITEHTQICSIHFKEDDYIPECENKGAKYLVFVSSCSVKMREFNFLSFYTF